MPMMMNDSICEKSNAFPFSLKNIPSFAMMVGGRDVDVALIVLACKTCTFHTTIILARSAASFARLFGVRITLVFEISVEGVDFILART